jgi:predicted metal-dependent phosphoesterase TrpH
VTWGGLAASTLIAASLAAGTIADVAPPRIHRVMGGYHVLAADFHVHTFPSGWAMLSPWDTVIEAGRQQLDVIAITPHDSVWASKFGRWASQRLGGPMVLVAEEITARDFHLLGIGLTHAVSSEQPLANAIADVHEQGGVAIAAHPYDDYWPTYDTAALAALDGAEVVRPEAQHIEALAAQLREFYARAKCTAIGDSDYHGIGTIGYSRTYVFARERSERGVLDAIREGRTVVYDRDRVFGDPAMIQLASEQGGLPRTLPVLPTPGVSRLFSRLTGVLAIVIVILFNGWNRGK